MSNKESEIGFKGWLKEHTHEGVQGTLIFLYVQPGASKTAIKGEFAQTPPRLKISVAAPPVEGEANKRVIQFLSECLGVPKSQLVFLSGEASRQKAIFIKNLNPITVQIRLLEE